MCHIRKYVIFWYEKKKVEAFSFFFHIFIKKDGRRRDRDISIEIQMKLDILPFQKRSFPQPLLLLHTPKHYLLKKKRNVKRTNYSVVVVVVHCGLKSKKFCFCYFQRGGQPSVVVQLGLQSHAECEDKKIFLKMVILAFWFTDTKLLAHIILLHYFFPFLSAMILPVGIGN